MKELFTYLLHSGISMMLLYLIYSIFLKKETFFKVNRFYLVSAILFSLLVPLFEFGYNWTPTGRNFAYVLQTITITPDKVGKTVNNHLSFFEGLFIVYITGVILFSLRFLFQLGQLAVLAGRSGIKKINGVNHVFIRRNFSPFSFFNIVFIHLGGDKNEDMKSVLEHEKVHIAQYHSLDLILAELLTIVQWFNPIIWYYRHSIREVHEYLADEGVLSGGIDPRSYQELLLSQSLGIQVNDLTNNFNHSLLKRRIIMMTRERSDKQARWKAMLAVPAILALTFVFSISVNQVVGQRDATTTENKEVPPPPPKVSSADQALGSNQEEQVYTVVQEMPEFKGGREKLFSYLVENIKYPEEAKKKGTQGTVFVTFVITKTGKVENVSILRGVDPLLDKEALRVVKMMPDWNPGKEKGKQVNVQFNLPIKFSLDDNAKKKETE